ncbi:MAG: tRNA pseudouridine(38-40) synthase TruA [Ignavibacteriales bacterium]|nr:tRNA pseudouridine(38-40) synthase TruA [Ignavibacteriales bacterium]
MNNYSLKIQYDGTNYAGWQIQNNAISIQQKIIDAIEVILKEKVNLIGSGRTDTGVHALGQVANFRTESELDLYRFRYSLNSILPNDISILKMEKVDESFHARFDAKERSYIYLFSDHKSPFYNNYSYYLPSISKFDFKYLNKISKVLLGNHDFTSFSRKNIEIEDKTCDVKEIIWHKGKTISTFYISANRFMHGMARTIIGTLLFAAEKKLGEDYLLEVLEQKNREEADESVPAKGLFLFKVRY